MSDLISQDNFILYTTPEGAVNLTVLLQDETIWLTQEQMSQLFDWERSVITKHIGNVFSEGELEEKSNVQILHISGSDKPVKYYNLDVIISVDYRVKSHSWATKTLKEYIIKGFVLDDNRLKQGEAAISMSPSNIDENWNLNFEKSTYFIWDKYDKSQENILEDGFTVLVKIGSSYGKAAYIKNLIEKTTINPQLVVLKPKKIDSYFLFLLITNASIQKQIQETVVGDAKPTLSQDSISKFEVLVPKSKEQGKIAICHLTLNKWIISQTEKIEQSKLHKKRA